MFARVFFRIRVTGIERIPARGAAIVAGNHLSALDGVALALVVGRDRRRMIRFLTGAEFFHLRWFGWALRVYRQIPVRRGEGDLGALDEAIHTVRSGALAGIFPEGLVSADPGKGLQRGRRGAARIALAADAPIVPVGIWGTQLRYPKEGLHFRRPWRPTVALAFGQPVTADGDAASSEDTQHLTDLVMARIGEQVEEARRLALTSRISVDVGVEPPRARTAERGAAGSGMMPAVDVEDAGRELHPPGYRRRLLVLLSAATFFEGYDTFVLSFVLALILGDLGGSESEAGWIRAFVGLGAVVAFALAAQADRIGRKRLLLITVIGYTIASFLTALSPGLVFLAAAQFLAQVFLGAEWAVAITMVVEDFPTHERGRALGIVTSMNTLGGILVGVLAFLGLQSTPLSWRAFYLVNLIPLVLIALGRRRMLETERYLAVAADPASARLDHTSIWEPWRPAFRRRILAVGLLTFFRHAAVAAAAFWWAYYAQQEVGMSVSLSGLYLAAAGVVGAARLHRGRAAHGPIRQDPRVPGLHGRDARVRHLAVPGRVGAADAPGPVPRDLLRARVGRDDVGLLDGAVPDLRPEPRGRLVPQRVRGAGGDRGPAARRHPGRPRHGSDRIDRRRDEPRDPHLHPRRDVHRLAVPAGDPARRSRRHGRSGGCVVRRAWLVSAVVVGLLVPSCGVTDRPEGVVERWLVSLNQGAAGRPDRYAPEALSDSVLPGWRDLDPGELDVIEVGDARSRPDGTLPRARSRSSTADDTVARAYAVVERRGGSLRIVRLEPPADTGPGIDPDFAEASAAGVPPLAWAGAIGAAALLILLTIGLMRLAPPPEAQTGSSR